MIKFKVALEESKSSPLKKSQSMRGSTKISPLRDGTTVEGKLSTTLITVEKKQYHAYDQDRWSVFKEGIVEGVNLGSPLKRKRDPKKYDFERRAVVVPFDPTNKYGTSDRSFEREYDGSDTNSSVGRGSIGGGGMYGSTSPGGVYLGGMGDGSNPNSPIFSSPSQPKRRSLGNAFFGHLGSDKAESDLYRFDAIFDKTIIMIPRIYPLIHDLTCTLRPLPLSTLPLYSPSLPSLSTFPL